MSFLNHLFAVAFTLLLAASLTPAQSSREDESRYAGSDACQACHDSLLAGVDDSAHGALFKNTSPQNTGCEACHGPGADHVNTGGDREKILRFSDASQDVVRRRCSRCHVKTGDQPHVAKGVGCLSCHAIHRYQERKALLIVSAKRLCQKCHSS